MIDVLLVLPDLSKPLTGTKVVDWKATNGTASYSGIKKGVKPIMREYTPNKARIPFNILTEEIYG